MVEVREFPFVMPFEDWLAVFPFDWQPDVIAKNRLLRTPTITHVDEGVGFAWRWQGIGGLRLKSDGVLLRCAATRIAQQRPGPSNLFNMITKRLTMKGFIVRDSLDRQCEFEKEAGGYFRAGKLKNKETVVAGIEQAVGAFIGLFAGKNIGKMVVKLA